MVAEIISVGTELLLGQIVDTNAAYLAMQMANLGIDVYRKTVVGDNLDRATTAIAEALERADIVLLTGGLGPTEDDITRDAIAKVINEPLIEHAEIAEQLRQRMARRRGHYGMSTLRQALLPASAQPIPNPVGTAPGILVERNGKLIIAMPGVPTEMKAMFEEHVRTILQKHTANMEAIIVSRVLRCIGIGESALTERIGDLIAAQVNPTIASLVTQGEVWLRLTAKAQSEDDARKIIAPVERAIRERVGEYIFGVDDESMERIVGDLLRERGWTIAIAESCTGGLIADTLTNVPGSSAYVKGAVVAYTDAVKHNVLGVSDEILSQYGAVSEPCACAMAEGVRRLLDTDIGLSVTGIAGPTGGTPTTPVGTVFIALADDASTICEHHLFGGGRRAIKERACKTALNLIRKRLLNLHSETGGG